MDDLRAAIKQTCQDYQDNMHHGLDRLVAELMELIEPTIFDARREAAQEMRERCRDIAYEAQQGAGTEAESEIAGYIRAKINNIKLDKPAPPERASAARQAGAEGEGSAMIEVRPGKWQREDE